jgi:hypothetical protein
MNNLENFIRNNKNAFDAEEPSAGHMERFEQMLPKPKVRTLSYVKYAATAAMITLMMTLSGLYIYDNWNQSDSSLPTLADAGPKYAEAEAYFVSTISQQQKTINSLKSEELLKDVDFEQDLKAMDVLYKKLQQDLNTNPDDPRVINAMIKHYQTRIAVMSQIVKQLEEAKKIKNNKTQHHEKISL